MTVQEGDGIAPRTVSIPLIIGIVLLPGVFAWFTLRKGYSTTAKALSFAWLGFIPALLMISAVWQAVDPEGFKKASEEGEQRRLAEKAERKKSELDKPENKITVIPVSLVTHDFNQNRERAADKYSKSTFGIVGYFGDLREGFNGIFSGSERRIIISDGSSQVDAYISGDDIETAKKFNSGQLIVVNCTDGDMSSVYPQFHKCSAPKIVNTGGDRAEIYYDDLVYRYNDLLH